ncbi:MAG: NAD-dependent epimerase/dehydratase family protein [Burkholderiales bacterium]
MQTILVTGANGFVGSHILAALAQRADVRAIAACRDKEKLPPGFAGEVREGDLADPSYVRRAIQGADAVCHAAAWTSLWGQKEHSRKLYLEPSLKLLEACVEQGVPRFLFVSTTSAAAPDGSRDPRSPGIPRPFWPHLENVVAIEDALRRHAGKTTMVNLRCGIFAGERYGLGLLPILLPRLRTHLVPWVAGGRTGLPIVDGSDIGQAFALAATAPGLCGYEAFNIVGPEVPSVRQVVEFLHAEYAYPVPHFSVPFPVAYAFAGLMEKLDPLVPWDPLVTRSIVHLLEETQAGNQRAAARIGYQAQVNWRDAVRKQVAEMARCQTAPMKMHKPLTETAR